MNKIEISILSIFYALGATDNISSVSTAEISSSEDLGIRYNTIYKYIHSLKKSGYINEGFKDGKQSTFFITAAGIKQLPLKEE